MASPWPFDPGESSDDLRADCRIGLALRAVPASSSCHSWLSSMFSVESTHVSSIQHAITLVSVIAVLGYPSRGLLELLMTNCMVTLL